MFILDYIPKIIILFVDENTPVTFLKTYNKVNNINFKRQ